MDTFELLKLDQDLAQQYTDSSLEKFEDGELYLEYSESESFVFDDGHMKNASYDIDTGFGLRGINGEVTSYAHSTDTSQAGLQRAKEAIISCADTNTSFNLNLTPPRTNLSLYPNVNPIDGFKFTHKTKLLAAIDQYARKKDPRVCQLSVSLSGSFRAITILRPNGEIFHDKRPLVKLSVSVTVKQGEKQENGSAGGGGRALYDEYINDAYWQDLVQKALDQALVNLEAVSGPSGESVVVLASGWTGILLHEAVGHGLEGDFNRKGTSAFAGKIGQQVAARGVTVIDDGTIKGRRGSLTFDDEGTKTQATTLIEDGILVGYLQDRQNAKLMGTSSTGNGRRESFAYAPMPRMTNTFMAAGDKDPSEIIASVKDGIYAVSFSGGQVDITNGKFVFNCTESYKIRDGKISEPLKNMALIGDGPTVLNYVSMIGNDFALDPGVGVCGKGGQGVPVGVGQPTIKIDKLTVGGMG